MTLGREAYVRRIAKDLFLREDVVEEVIDRFIDVAVEEIVNTGELKIHRLLSISYTDYAAYEAGKGSVPAHRRLKIRLSDGVHKLFRFKQANPQEVVDGDNWKARLSTLTPVRKEAKPQVGSPLYNPLLDED